MPWGKNKLSEIKNIGLFCSVNCVYIPQHNSSHRPAGRSSMFNTPFTVWTRHRASTPGMGGGSSPSEGWTILQQESPNPGWKPKSGRRGIGGEWQRWLKVTRQSLTESPWVFPLKFDCHFRRPRPTFWEYPLRCSTSPWTNEPHRSDVTTHLVPVSVIVWWYN